MIHVLRVSGLRSTESEPESELGSDDAPETLSSAAPTCAPLVGTTEDTEAEVDEEEDDDDDDDEAAKSVEVGKTELRGLLGISPFSGSDSHVSQNS